MRTDRLYETRRFLEQSLSIDPTYARSFAMLSGTYVTAWVQTLDADHLNPAALDRAHDLARKAVQLAPNLPQAHCCLGFVLTWKGQHTASITQFEKATSLNPNFTDWRFAAALVYAGEPQRAVQVTEAHMRLDPFYPPLAPLWSGAAYYMQQKYAEALTFLLECLSRAPTMRSVHGWLSATYAQLGQLNEARAEAAEVLRIEPGWTIDGVGRSINKFKRPEDADHFFDGLRKAGLPER